MSQENGHDRSSRFWTTTHTTAHRLLGCSIGEVLGLTIGVTLGIGLWFTLSLGEAVSIAVMEIAMNVIDYALGGMSAMSVAEPVLWYSLLAAIPAGYIAAWPVNWWLIGKNLKHCH